LVLSLRDEQLRIIPLGSIATRRAGKNNSSWFYRFATSSDKGGEQWSVNSAKKFLKPQVPLFIERNCNMKRFRAAKRQREAAIEAAIEAATGNGNRKRQKVEK